MSDGISANTYEITLLITENQMPYFVTELGPFEFRQNAGRVEVPLPEIVDPNGDETLVEVIPVSNTEYFELIPVSEMLVFFIKEDTLPGAYDFLIVLSDPEESNLYPITVFVIENNAPFFTEALEYPVYKANSGVQWYQLPRAKDNELDFVFIKVSVPENLTATHSLMGLLFTIDNNVTPGEYLILI